MNKKNWKNKRHSAGRWLAKLTEEVGEVAKEIADRPGMEDLPIKGMDRVAIAQTVTELQHVEFIAKCFREDLERRLS